MPDLLLEIGTEEIPAGYIQPGLKQMREAMQSLLQRERIDFEEINTYGSPRRLAILARGVAAFQRDADIEVMGPPKAAAYDKQGNPTKTAEGFARSQGTSVEDLMIKTMPKGEYLYVKKHIKGRPALEILQESLPAMITGISFPKSMRWGNKEIRFARPIQWILALFDDKVIPFELDGIHSGKITYGHRFLAPSPISISQPKEYVQSMEKAFVIVDIDKRKDMIVAGIQGVQEGKNTEFRIQESEGRRQVGADLCVCPPDKQETENTEAQGEGLRDVSYEINNDLLDEVTCLVEYPVVLKGGFDEKYLSLPQDVVITSMCEHQRYFPVMNNNTLLPYFLVVANTNQSPDIVREGNERVLRARLSDAAFFWDSDRKVTLDERVEQQKGVVWQEKAGTLYEKTQRIEGIAEWIAEELNRQQETTPDPSIERREASTLDVGADLCVCPLKLDVGADLCVCPLKLEKSKASILNIEGVKRAAWLCKADLLTGMVGEFPTLQGIMGYHYASSAGEPEDVAMAIKEHYLPKSFDDNIPETLMGAIVSIADKIDSIVACFNVGLIPTGSEDPYALRRQAQGIINIILKQNLPINLFLLVEEACKCCHAQEGLTPEVMRFLKQRLEYAITTMGFAADTVVAVLEVDFRSPTDTLLRVKALEEIRKMPDVEPLSSSFKRVLNILRSEQVVKAEAVKESMLKEESEHKLYQSIQGIKETVEALVEKADYLETLRILAGLRGDIDNFFDNVMVMAEDAEIRGNRLALLESIARLFLRIADISLLRQSTP
ncbi:glycine--tRNA ligase subunit beta [bacterium]|nr:glycine--tRNA ligase subunit beta [bacterium]